MAGAMRTVGVGEDSPRCCPFQRVATTVDHPPPRDFELLYRYILKAYTNTLPPPPRAQRTLQFEQHLTVMAAPLRSLACAVPGGMGALKHVPQGPLPSGSKEGQPGGPERGAHGWSPWGCSPLLLSTQAIPTVHVRTDCPCTAHCMNLLQVPRVLCLT